MADAKFSSSFALFLNTIRISHTVASDGSPDEHVQLVASVMRALQGSGYSAHEGGLSEGQEKHEISGYVLARNDKGTMIWCYTDWGDWRVRGGTIYDRSFSKLPFDPTTAKMFPGESPPTRERAKADGYLTPCKLTILVEKTDQTSKTGEPIWKFVDVLSAVAAKAPAEEKEKVPAADPEATKTAICEYVQQKVTNVEQLDTAIARAGQRKGQLSAEQWDYVVRSIRSKIAILLATSDQPIGIEDVARKHIGILGAEVVNGVIDFVRTAASATQV